MECGRRPSRTSPNRSAPKTRWSATPKNGRRPGRSRRPTPPGSRRLVDELASAKSAAEQASRAKSQFLANMSHEIRTPMNGVLGICDLLLSGDPSARERQLLELMRSSGDALVRIVNDILDLSKIEAGRLELDIVDFDLPAVIAELSAVTTVRAEAKGLKFHGRRESRGSTPREGRSGTDPTGPREPARQCGQVHRQGRDRRGRLVARLQGRRRPVRHS